MPLRSAEDLVFTEVNRLARTLPLARSQNVAQDAAVMAALIALLPGMRMEDRQVARTIRRLTTLVHKLDGRCFATRPTVKQRTILVRAEAYTAITILRRRPLTRSRRHR